MDFLLLWLQGVATQEPSTSQEMELDSCELDELSNKPSGGDMRPLHLKSTPATKSTAMDCDGHSEENRELVRRVVKTDELTEVGVEHHASCILEVVWVLLEAAEPILQHGFAN